MWRHLPLASRKQRVCSLLLGKDGRSCWRHRSQPRGRLVFHLVWTLKRPRCPHQSPSHLLIQALWTSHIQTLNNHTSKTLECWDFLDLRGLSQTGVGSSPHQIKLLSALLPAVKGVRTTHRSSLLPLPHFHCHQMMRKKTMKMRSRKNKMMMRMRSWTRNVMTMKMMTTMKRSAMKSLTRSRLSRTRSLAWPPCGLSCWPSWVSSRWSWAWAVWCVLPPSASRCRSPWKRASLPHLWESPAGEKGSSSLVASLYPLPPRLKQAPLWVQPHRGLCLSERVGAPGSPSSMSWQPGTEDARVLRPCVAVVAQPSFGCSCVVKSWSWAQGPSECGNPSDWRRA